MSIVQQNQMPLCFNALKKRSLYGKVKNNFLKLPNPVNVPRRSWFQLNKLLNRLIKSGNKINTLTISSAGVTKNAIHKNLLVFDVIILLYYPEQSHQTPFQQPRRIIQAVQPFLLKIDRHLLRYFTKISPRRAKSTPAGNFCSCLVSASSLFKRLTQKLFLTISPNYSAILIYCV